MHSSLVVLLLGVVAVAGCSSVSVPPNFDTPKNSSAASSTLRGVVFPYSHIAGKGDRRLTLLSVGYRTVFLYDAAVDRPISRASPNAYAVPCLEIEYLYDHSSMPDEPVAASQVTYSVDGSDFQSGTEVLSHSGDFSMAKSFGFRLDAKHAAMVRNDAAQYANLAEARYECMRLYGVPAGAKAISLRIRLRMGLPDEDIYEFKDIPLDAQFSSTGVSPTEPGVK